MTKPHAMTHIDDNGRAKMVDVSDKPATQRFAAAEASVLMSAELVSLIRTDSLTKGSALATARIAGIMAAKRTDELIPLCHSIPIDHVDVSFLVKDDRVLIRAEVSTRGPTGVEMEAMTAAAVAGLTLIDMGKAVDRHLSIDALGIITKTGGRSGDHHRPSKFGPGANDG